MTVTLRSLSARIRAAADAMKSCRLCPRACGVDRMAGKTGYCGAGAEARCFREVLHYGEESELVPSHQVYFTGCNLRCEFCAVAEWNESPAAAPAMPPAALRRRVLQRRREGARNLNLLGGEPSVNLYGIFGLLDRLPADYPVIWNSNMYFTPQAAELLDGVVDLYLADFKCGNSDCARKMLGAGDYVETVQENLRFARTTAGLIVRHLVLPGHKTCCLKPILRWMKAEMPDAKLRLRRDYLPPSSPRRAPARTLTEREFVEAVDAARGMGLNVIS